MTDFRQKFGSQQALTITLASLANAAGRLSTQVDQGAQFGFRGQLTVKITTGSVAPTAGSLIEFYLVRGGLTDGSRRDGGYGASDASVGTRPPNADLIGSIVVTATTEADYLRNFILEGVPRYFSVIVWNATGQAFSASTGQEIHWQPVFDEVV